MFNVVTSRVDDSYSRTSQTYIMIIMYVCKVL